MIIIKCDGCGTELWEGLTPAEKAQNAHEGAEIRCADCIMYGDLYYNPHYGDDKLCKCGHTYYRHYDTYENMSPVGCKYCGWRCERFRPANEGEMNECTR